MEHLQTSRSSNARIAITSSESLRYLRRQSLAPELVTLTLDLYFSGLSLRKIARNVNDHFEIDLGATTIYNWIQKYIPVISSYVNSLNPQLSDTWHTDELFVKMKGGETRKVKLVLLIYRM
jgi:transposase-like protein